HGKAVQFALEFRQDKANGSGGTGGGGNDVHGSGPGPAQILMGQVQDSLVVGISMDSGHEALLNAEGIVDNLGHRCQAVGGAGGVGNHMVLLRIVEVFINSHDDGDVLFFSRSGDDHLLGPGVDVPLSLIPLAED